MNEITKATRTFTRSLSIILFGLLILFNSCNSNKFEVDVSNIHVDIKIKRLEKDLKNVDFDNIEQDVEKLQEKYGDFFDVYNSGVIQIGSAESASYASFLKRFLIDYRIKQAYEQIEAIYPELQDLEKQLTEAFKYYKYYFPNKKIPQIYTCLTGFNQSIIVTNDAIAIGLDKYLGSACKLYQRLGWSKYKINKMNKNMIALDCLKSWIMTEYEYNDSINTLATNMIYNGQVMFALQSFFPHTPQNLLWGYTDDQLYWAQRNEDKVWGYLKKEKLLFTSEQIEISRYIVDAPFTSTFRQNSAPRTGIYVGTGIVESFMDNNPAIQLKELMQMTDYNKILRLSKYAP